MKHRIRSFLLAFVLLFGLYGLQSAPASATQSDFDGQLHIENGIMQPMLNYSDLRDPNYSNEDSDILRFCVYVETDHDTDQDGMADLVKVLVQVPRAAVEGKFKAATIYDPTPYGVGTVDEFGEDTTPLY